jgi:16S rRNA (cytidine1402-2'-O)-methyltransferase
MLKPGLYIIATPIGNLGDITLRALETLKACDVIVCEDTRVTKKLLSHFGIQKPLLSYHDYNADEVRPILIKKLHQDQIVGLVSDAGTPLISDPGYKLVRHCQEENIYVTTLPGASSVLAGLILSGMPSNRFTFCGFVDKSHFPSLASYESTLIFFESAKRLLTTLVEMKAVFNNRDCSVVREISKIFEESRRGSFDDLIHYYTHEGYAKGEVVIVLGPPAKETLSDENICHALRMALQSHTLKDAVTLVSGSLNVPKKHVYKLAINLRNDS